MRKVRAQQGHRDHIKNHDKRIFKAGDDHSVWIIHAQFCQFRVSSDGEMQEMENHECQDCQAGSVALYSYG